MRWAIFSDVHGNLPALERFIECSVSVDAFLCLGDTVNYGPWNDECLELIHTLPNLIYLEGNHERLFLGTESIEHEIELVREFTKHSLLYFSRRDLISGLHSEYRLGRYRCMHTLNGMKIYSDSQFIPEFDHVIGHSHHQFSIQRADKTVVNCGSIGQNRGRIDLINFAIYDTVTDRMELRSETYAVDSLINELKIRNYPRKCVEYYLGKLPVLDV